MSFKFIHATIQHAHAGVVAGITANKAAVGHNDRASLKLLFLVAATALVLAPGFAHAAPWDSAGNYVLGILNGGFTRTLAIISMIACGIAALAGKLSWDWVIKIAIGLVLIFGGSALVDGIIGAAGA